MNGKNAVEAHSDSASFTYNNWKTNGFGGMDWRLSRIDQYWTGNFFSQIFLFLSGNSRDTGKKKRIHIKLLNEKTKIS